MRLFQTAILGLSILIFSASSGASAHNLTEAQAEGCEEALEGLVKVDIDNPRAFHGMTNAGYSRLLKAQQALTTTINNGNNVFEGLHGILTMDLIAMATRHNVLLAGPGGGAKSAHIEWLVPPEHLYVQQMNEFLTPANIFGAIPEESVRNGTMVRNRSGKITEFEYAMVDELNNLNPSATGDMMSFMNPGERKHEGYKAKTRTVFSTGNATRSQMLRTFLLNNQQSGAAFLNRSIFKSWVPNWLAEDEMWRLMQTDETIRHLKSVARYGNQQQRAEATRRLVGLQSQYIDMEVIEAFAQHAFVPHEELKTALLEFANEFRAAMRQHERTSYEAAEAKNFNVLVDTPSADWTTRFFKELLTTIQFSAALDYLQMVGPQALDPKNLKEPIPLTPMSLWRIMYTSTTIGPGENRFNPVTMQIDFNLTKNMVPELELPDHKVALDGCKDAIEVGELEFMWKEQEMTNRILHGINGRLAVSAKELAPYMPPPTEDQLLGIDKKRVDFEVAWARYQNQVRRLSPKVELKHAADAAAAAAVSAEPPAQQQ